MPIFRAAERNNPALCGSLGATERRKIFTLGREPQDQVVPKKDEPRSGGRFTGLGVLSLWG